MYLKYWRLREEPFAHSIDGRLFYETPQHEEAVARLVYTAKHRKGAALLYGDYGTGKSMACRVFLSRLQHVGDFSVGFVDNPLLDGNAVLTDLLMQVSGQPVAIESYPGVYRALRQALQEKQSRGFSNLVIVEEAQLFDTPRRIEPLRLLMNMRDASGNPLVTLFFVGHLSVMGVFAKTPPLLQRVSSRWLLSPLTLEQTRGYVTHRLSAAGGNGWIVDDSAIEALHRYSRGILRLINNAADMALYLGMVEESVKINREHVDRVVRDMERGLKEWQEE